MNNGAYFHLTNASKYLRYIVTSCLRDTIDITARITMACGYIRALEAFLASREVSLDIKLKLYLAIPLINTVLRGCKWWALLESDTKALEVFHHRSIRQNLRLSTMKRVRGGQQQQ
jgi:hypothetical protein